MAGSFVSYTTKVRAKPYFGSVSSDDCLSPVYPSGNVSYRAFIPDAAAVSAAGYPAGPYRLLIDMQAQGGGEYTGANEGAQMSNGGEMVHYKLGYGGTPSATWPTIVIFPQIVTDWTGSHTNSNIRKQRAYLWILEACIDDICRRHNIDRTRIYATSVSSGGNALLTYAYLRATRPREFKYDFAATILVSSWHSGQVRQVIPDMDQAWSLADMMLPDLVRAYVKAGFPMWLCYSSGDQTVAPNTYTVVQNAFLRQCPVISTTTSGAGTAARTDKVLSYNMRLTEYTGGVGTAPDHVGIGGVWDYFYGGNVLGAVIERTQEPWVWMNRQQYLGAPRRGRVKRMTGVR